MIDTSEFDESPGVSVTSTTLVRKMGRFILKNGSPLFLTLPPSLKHF